MPYYSRLKRFPRQGRVRTARGIQRLKRQLAGTVPAKRPDTLLLATWNIRDFDSNKFRHGPRETESFYYIAEIVSAFDLVAIQSRK